MTERKTSTQAKGPQARKAETDKAKATHPEAEQPRQDGQDIPDSQAVTCPVCQYRFKTGDAIL